MNYLFIFRITQATLLFFLLSMLLNHFFSKENTSIRNIEKSSTNSHLNADVVVFPAKKIITIDPTKLNANVIVVKNNRVFYIGKINDALNIIKDEKYFIDTSFKNKVIFPGIVDAGSYLLFNSIVNTNIFKEIQIQDTLRSKRDLKQLKNTHLQVDSSKENGLENKAIIFYTSQDLSFIKDLLTLDFLDSVFPNRAVLLWDRVLAEGYYNSHFKELAQLQSQSNTIDKEIDFIKTMALFYSKDTFKQNLQNNFNNLTKKGVTTVVYSNFGAFDFYKELEAINEVYSEQDIPLRLVIRFAGNYIYGKDLAKKEKFLQNNKPKNVYYKKSIDISLEDCLKDNKEHSQSSICKDFATFLAPVWRNGYNVRISIADSLLGNDILNTIKYIQEQTYKLDSRFTIGSINNINYSLMRYLSEFNMFAFVNGSYFNSLLEASDEKKLELITELNVLDEFNIKYNINTDVAPFYYKPFEYIKLLLKTKAITQLEDKNAIVKEIDDALMLLTVIPAQVLSMDIEVGSIEQNKFADFIILNQDPYDLKYNMLPTVKVEHVVINGKVFKEIGNQEVKNSE